jgi:hypothetical protein
LPQQHHWYRAGMNPHKRYKPTHWVSLYALY